MRRACTAFEVTLVAAGLYVAFMYVAVCAVARTVGDG